MRIEDCVFEGGSGLNVFCPLPSQGGLGIQVQGSHRVALVRCTLRGGPGAGSLFTGCFGGVGGDGGRIQSSTVALYDSTAWGGIGGPGDDTSHLNGGPGGHGWSVAEATFLFASRSTFRGGYGGFGFGGGHGGDALEVLAGTHSVLHGCTQIGGNGGTAKGGSRGQPGGPQSGTGSVTFVSGPPRVFLAPALASAGTTLAVTVYGQPGDQVWLFAGEPALRYDPELSGVRLVAQPSLVPLAPQGVVPASGVLALDVPLAALPAGVPAAPCFLQGFVIDAQGAAHYASPLHPTVLDPSAAVADCNANGTLDTCELLTGTSIDCNANGCPDECEVDCNANGVADECDIAHGTSADANHDGILDECQASGITRHVDASAPPGGDGSAAAPFRTLAEAFAPSLGGDTILVADGVYTGAQNRDLDFGGRDLVVRSVNGPAACVIDCALAGRAFRLRQGESAAARIQGLTVRRGKPGAQSSGVGGGIAVEIASPTIEDCVFESCVAYAGGGLDLYNSQGRVVGCRFVTNTAESGGGLRIVKHGPSVVGCHFEHNTATSKGGGASVGGQGPASSVFSHCTFLDNHAYWRGGGLAYEPLTNAVPPPLRIEECLVAGNSAPDGGAGLRFVGAVEITGSTFADPPGSLAILGNGTGPSLKLSNSILWQTSPVNPFAVSLAGTAGYLQVDFCDVQNGIAGVSAGFGGTLVWGTGNISLSPLFVDPLGPDGNPQTAIDNDYRLGAGSPCIDAGDNTLLPLDAFDLDADTILDEPLPLDLAGAPRQQDDPAVTDTGIGSPPVVDLGPYEKAP